MGEKEPTQKLLHGKMTSPHQPLLPSLPKEEPSTAVANSQPTKDPRHERGQTQGRGSLPGKRTRSRNQGVKSVSVAEGVPL